MKSEIAIRKIRTYEYLTYTRLKYQKFSYKNTPTYHYVIRQSFCNKHILSASQSAQKRISLKCSSSINRCINYLCIQRFKVLFEFSIIEIKIYFNRNTRMFDEYFVSFRIQMFFSSLNLKIVDFKLLIISFSLFFANINLKVVEAFPRGN